MQDTGWEITEDRYLRSTFMTHADYDKEFWKHEL